MTVNDQHAKPGFKRMCRAKCKDDICTELCLWVHWRLSAILKTCKKCTKYVYSVIEFNTLYMKYFMFLEHEIFEYKKFFVHSIQCKKCPLFFNEFQLITVLLLICDSSMSWSTRCVSLKLCVGFSILDSVSFLSKFKFN